MKAMNSRKVAVVTGSNKGIGYAIVKGLCDKFNGDVYLTARDSGRGQSAVEKLKALGYNPIFHQLDISDQSSVDTFRDYLRKNHGGIDLLINNAAIAYQADATEPIAVQAEETIRVNYYGTKRVCDTLFPLLRQNGRVVNVSSSAGHLSIIRSDNLRAKFRHENLPIKQLDSLMDKFVKYAAVKKDAKDNRYEEEWGNYLVAYIVSKVGISCLTFIQQRLLNAEIPNRNISVNSVHPGYIETDLTRELRTHKDGALSIEEGAIAPLFLALDANLKGQYVWKDGSVVDWYAPSIEHITTMKKLSSGKHLNTDEKS